MKLKQDTLIAAAVALIVGIILGAVGGGALQGTAVDSGEDSGENVEVDPTRFYLVKYEDAQNYLAQQAGGNTELENSLTSLSSLASVTDLSQFVGQEASVNTILVSLQNSLVSQDGDNNVALNTCLGVDSGSDPYATSGAGVYVYIEASDNVDLPDELTGNPLEAPKTDSLTWSSTCVKDEDANK